MGEYGNASGRAENRAAEPDKIENGTNDKEDDLSRTNEESVISSVGIDPPDPSSETRVLSVEGTANGSFGRMASKELSRSSSRSKSKVKADVTTEYSPIVPIAEQVLYQFHCNLPTSTTIHKHQYIPILQFTRKRADGMILQPERNDRA
jgi:hypothetical protein